jgi:hypothetical protein
MWCWAGCCIDGHVVLLQGKIKSLEQIYLFSLPVKEYQIVDFFLVRRAAQRSGPSAGAGRMRDGS